VALVFCCPECGATLRATRSAYVAVIMCTQCREPIRVPASPHNAEAAIDVPTIRPDDASRGQAGLTRLNFSLWIFALSTFIVLLILSLFLSLDLRPNIKAPEWYQITVHTLIVLWLLVSWTGCIMRIWGYCACLRIATSVGVEGWIRLSTWGASLIAVGQFSVVLLYLTRTIQMMPTEVMPLIMAGLLSGAMGIAMEFGILSVLHRILWETAGWQAANLTGRFAITLIGSTITTLSIVCIGLIGLSSLHKQDPAALTLPQTRIAMAGMVGALIGFVFLVSMKYRRLLMTTHQALAQPEAYVAPEKPITPNSQEMGS